MVRTCFKSPGGDAVARMFSRTMTVADAAAQLTADRGGTALEQRGKTQLRREMQGACAFVAIKDDGQFSRVDGTTRLRDIVVQRDEPIVTVEVIGDTPLG